jgi:outer membrane protein OmpA-like peptidoglycan-associated protein
LLGTIAIACGPSANERPCSPESWSGTCQLAAVRKVQEKEFPVPHIIVEAVYRPVQNAQYSGFTPGDTVQVHKVLANQELALRDHLDKQSTVACHLQAPPPGQCLPGTLAVSVQPFDSLATASSETDTTPKPAGCAQIESQATQDQMQRLGAATTTMPEEFQFERGSAEAPANASQMANQLAQRIRTNPRLECIAVVGQIAPGESQGLADQRARAIKNLLLENGVDPSRLMIITTTVSVFGSGSGPPPDEPDKRRVRLRVLLENKAQ